MLPACVCALFRSSTVVYLLRKDAPVEIKDPNTTIALKRPKHNYHAKKQANMNHTCQNCGKEFESVSMIVMHNSQPKKCKSRIKCPYITYIDLFIDIQTLEWSEYLSKNFIDVNKNNILFTLFGCLGLLGKYSLPPERTLVDILYSPINATMYMMKNNNITYFMYNPTTDIIDAVELSYLANLADKGYGLDICAMFHKSRSIGHPLINLPTFFTEQLEMFFSDFKMHFSSTNLPDLNKKALYDVKPHQYCILHQKDDDSNIICDLYNFWETIMLHIAYNRVQNAIIVTNMDLYNDEIKNFQMRYFGPSHKIHKICTEERVASASRKNIFISKHLVRYNSTFTIYNTTDRFIGNNVVHCTRFAHLIYPSICPKFTWSPADIIAAKQHDERLSIKLRKYIDYNNTVQIFDVYNDYSAHIILNIQNDINKLIHDKTVFYCVDHKNVINALEKNKQIVNFNSNGGKVIVSTKRIFKADTQVMLDRNDNLLAILLTQGPVVVNKPSIVVHAMANDLLDGAIYCTNIDFVYGNKELPFALLHRWSARMKNVGNKDIDDKNTDDIINVMMKLLIPVLILTRYLQFNESNSILIDAINAIETNDEYKKIMDETDEEWGVKLRSVCNSEYVLSNRVFERMTQIIHDNVKRANVYHIAYLCDEFHGAKKGPFKITTAHKRTESPCMHINNNSSMEEALYIVDEFDSNGHELTLYGTLRGISQIVFPNIRSL